MLGDQSLVLGLLNTLERDLLPVIERGADVQAWSRANRIADGVLALLSEGEREAIELPSRVGVLQALFTAAKTTRDDKSARACAVYTFAPRSREASAPQRHSPPPPSFRGPPRTRGDGTAAPPSQRAP